MVRGGDGGRREQSAVGPARRRTLSRYALSFLPCRAVSPDSSIYNCGGPGPDGCSDAEEPPLPHSTSTGSPGEEQGVLASAKVKLSSHHINDARAGWAKENTRV